jgi:hypothetical protein
MYWLSNYRHKIETLGRAAWWQKDHCPLTGNEENRENILGHFCGRPALASCFSTDSRGTWSRSQLW